MTDCIAQPELLPGKSLINTASNKYQEAAEQFRQLKANWQRLPAQQTIMLALEAKEKLRETLRVLDQAMTGSEETASLIAECRQQADDLRGRVDNLLANIQELIESCLANEEARERFQTAKVVVILLTAGFIIVVGAIAAVLMSL